MKHLFTILLGAFALLTTPHAQAQQANALLAGHIHTDSWEPLPRAAVLVVHLPTGVRRTALADTTGAFSIAGALSGGPFTVQVSHLGYRTQVITNVFLTPDKPLTFDLVLPMEVLVVGTRRPDRTALNTAVPVDVFDMRELAATAPQTDLTQLLTYAAPSLNSTRQVTADGADHIDAASLRGLGPDQTLVLVNGHRRHTTALINLLGNRGVGNVGTDLNTLPANALDRVEILRDGAAAQYGSDAIAGVINLQLKDDSHGGNILLNTGVHRAGDGLSTELSLNKGLVLPRQGFLNLTGDVDYRGATTRGGTARDVDSWPVFSTNRAQEDAALAANGKTYQDFQQRNGNSQVLNTRAFYNAGLPLSKSTKLYSFGGYNYRRGTAAGLWRLPSRSDAQVVESIFPLGYQPLINTRIHDASAVLGLTTKLADWQLDVSQTLGQNRMAYDLTNTVNASLGAASPTAFQAGSFQFTELVSNATVSRLFKQALAGTNVAFGGEFRQDDYQITAGEEASWRTYGQGRAGAAGGSQGFVGFSPASAVAGSRYNAAAFLDVDADLTKRWTVNAALRAERYSDFGSAFTYKLATRWQLAKALAVRGAYNTGFRAPSLQQERYRQLSITPTVTGTAYAGIFNVDSDIARAAGIGALRPETSGNLSAGLVLAPGRGLTVTADAYQIDISNRVILSGLFGAGISAPLDAALANARASSAQFFTNAVDTRTQGLDLVASYGHGLGAGSLLLSAAANFNQTRIRQLRVPAAFQALQNDNDLGNNYVDQRQLSLLETGNPTTKINFSVGYQRGQWDVTVRNTYFGQVAYYDNNYDDFDFGSSYLVFRPKTVTDLLVTYKPSRALGLTLGASNLFNIMPDTKLQAVRNGHAPDGFASVEAFNSYFLQRFGYPSYLPYDRDVIPYEPVQMGFNGTFLYLKAAYSLGL